MSNVRPHELHQVIRSWLLAEDPYGMSAQSISPGGRIEPPMMDTNPRSGKARGAGEAAGDELGGRYAFGRRLHIFRRAAVGQAAPQAVGMQLAGVDVGEVVAVQIRDRQLAEDVVQDRGRRLDRVVAGDRPRQCQGVWLE